MHFANRNFIFLEFGITNIVIQVGDKNHNLYNITTSYKYLLVVKNNMKEFSVGIHESPLSHMTHM